MRFFITGVLILRKQQIHNFLHVIQKELGFVLSDHSYSIMFYSCLIILARTAAQQTLLSCDNEYFLITCPEYKVIEANKELLKQDLNRYETMQLSSLLIGSNYAQNSNLRENEWFRNTFCLYLKSSICTANIIS